MNQKDNEHIKMKKILYNNLYIVKLLFESTPVYGISIIIDAIRHNLINFLEQTICVYYILKTIELHGSFYDILKMILLFIVLDIFAAIMCNLYEQCIKLKYQPIVRSKVMLPLYEKAKSVDITCYDDSSYYNDFVFSASQAEKIVDRAENLLRMIFTALTVLCCYGLFFLTKDILSIIFVLISFMLRSIILMYANKINYKYAVDINKLQRKRDFTRRIFYLKDCAKEIRLNKKAVSKLHEDFEAVNNEVQAVVKKYGGIKFILNYTGRYMSSEFFLDIIYVIYLVIKAGIYHMLTLSRVVVLYNSAANLRRGLSTVVDMAPYMIETSLYMDKVRSFMEYENKIKNNKLYELPDTITDIELKNVSFGYGKNQMILQNINMKIEKNKKVALVGFNGAGKTTLIMLLLRLYEPQEGEIYLNGVDIRQYDLEEYRKYIGVVFQDYKLFATSIGQNVVMGIVQANENEQIKKVLSKCGLSKKLSNLKSGVDTNVTYEFKDDGIEFSGGEAQKLAISRAFYKNTPMIVLDEPSAALDPISEHKLNLFVDKLSNEKTLIFISHRLSTIRNADCIYMLDNGKIIEAGTHEQLLQLQCKYYEMWKIQAGKYIEVEKEGLMI